MTETQNETWRHRFYLAWQKLKWSLRFEKPIVTGGLKALKNSTLSQRNKEAILSKYRSKKNIRLLVANVLVLVCVVVWLSMSVELKVLEASYHSHFFLVTVVHSWWSLCLIPWWIWRRMARSTLNQRAVDESVDYSGSPSRRINGKSQVLRTKGEATREYLDATKYLTLDHLRYFILGFIGLVSGWTWYISIPRTSLAANTCIYQSSIAFVYIFSVVLLKEKTKWYKTLSVAICILGVMTVAHGTMDQQTLSPISTIVDENSQNAKILEAFAPELVADIAKSAGMDSNELIDTSENTNTDRLVPTEAVPAWDDISVPISYDESAVAESGGDDTLAISQYSLRIRRLQVDGNVTDEEIPFGDAGPVQSDAGEEAIVIGTAVSFLGLVSFTQQTWGYLMLVISMLLYSLYEVTYKICTYPFAMTTNVNMKDGSIVAESTGNPHMNIEGCRALGIMGATSIPMLPFVWLLDMTGIEPFRWPTSYEWYLLSLIGVIDTIYNLLILLAIGLSTPLTVAIGLLLAMPTSMIVQHYTQGDELGLESTLGACLILVGFCLHVGGSRISFNRATGIVVDQGMQLPEDELNEISDEFSDVCIIEDDADMHSEIEFFQDNGPLKCTMTERDFAYMFNRVTIHDSTHPSETLFTLQDGIPVTPIRLEEQLGQINAPRIIVEGDIGNTPEEVGHSFIALGDVDEDQYVEGRMHTEGLNDKERK